MAPITRMRNARRFTPTADRPQIGTRPTIGRAFLHGFGGRAIQGFCKVSRKAALAGYVIPPADPEAGYDPCKLITAGTSLESLVMTGNVFGMDSVPSMTWCYHDDPSPDGGSNTSPVNTIAVSPESTHYAWSVNYVDSAGATVTRISYARVDGTVLWTRKLSAVGEAYSCNTIAISKLWVLVCVNRYVYALRRDTGVVAQAFGCGGWSTETIRVRVKTLNGLEYAYIAFDGSNTAATLPSGILVSAGKYARQFRSGVMKCSLEMDNQAASTVLTHIAFGPQLLTSATFYEAQHKYLRISEQHPYAPRGVSVTDMDVFSDGGVVVTTTNTGWGPDSNPVNPGYAAPDLTQVGKLTIWRFDRNGTLIWATDEDSWYVIGDGGFYNDVLDPTVLAVAIDSNDDVYVGGRLTSGDVCAFGVRGFDGSERWRAKLEDLSSKAIRQGGIAVDPSDTHVYFAGDRNTAWTGSGGANAHLWKLNSASGAVLANFDLGANVSALGVAVQANGEFGYCGGKV